VADSGAQPAPAAGAAEAEPVVSKAEPVTAAPASAAEPAPAVQAAEAEPVVSKAEPATAAPASAAEPAPAVQAAEAEPVARKAEAVTAAPASVAEPAPTPAPQASTSLDVDEPGDDSAELELEPEEGISRKRRGIRLKQDLG
jgi:hypothetical protein